MYKHKALLIIQKIPYTTIPTDFPSASLQNIYDIKFSLKLELNQQLIDYFQNSGVINLVHPSSVIESLPLSFGLLSESPRAN